jgi:hypothetical protein
MRRANQHILFDNVSVFLVDMKLRLQSCLGVIAVGLVFVAGCSEGPIKTVPVYGTITFVDREPPELCEVTFQPLKVDGPLRPSFTERKPDGSYRVQAFQNSKGLIPGTYRIQLVTKDLKPGADRGKDANWKLTKYDVGEVQVDANSGGVEHNIEVRMKKG